MLRQQRRHARRRSVMISDNVRPHHLERKAILYVRQSSARQVLHNRESSGLQYVMRDRLTALGWSEVEVIDDDLGRSAAGRPAYHPSVLLKLYIYGYLNRAQSSRRLEREAGRNVEVMWLTGRLVPDHK